MSTNPTSDPLQRVNRQFLDRVTAGDLPPPRTRCHPTAAPPASPLVDSPSPTELDELDELVELFRAQVLSRHLDRMARELRAAGEGYYTIGSSGHEGMAAVAAALRPTDPAFLHYRDAAFQIARSAQVDGVDPLRDLLLSFLASADDPISGGRHKVLGSKALTIPPQTSTIASHLPKAVGAAYSIRLAAAVEPEHRAFPGDAVVVASFGDASVNHASAQAAFNTAGWTAHQGVALPLLLVCEDNGLGISVPTPSGWVAASMAVRAGLAYRACDGLDLIDTYRATAEAAAEVRRTGRPAFLHLSCVRLFGHAGSDVESGYRSPAEIAAAEADDPLLHSARIVMEAGLSASEVIELYEEVDERLRKAAAEAIATPRLRDRDEVMASIVPPPRPCRPVAPAPDDRRRELFGEVELRAMERPQPMAKLLNWALTDLLATHPEVVVAGEDVGRKGGVYGVTQRLQTRFGPRRVIDTILDEQSILGLAIGLAHNGFIPIPEIQFLAYLHNAEDQLRGEAATLPFFSGGRFANPMVVRIAALGYQKGFGGHFHNDNSIAVLRDIPGLIVACPSNGRDGALMLREAVRLAREEQRVVVFLEPIALYATADLDAPGDGGWARRYPPPGSAELGIGEVGVDGEPGDVAIVTYGNGTRLATQARQVLAARHGIGARVIDIRWLAPVPVDAIADACADCSSILVVDECRRTGSLSEQLVTELAERGRHAARLCAADSFIATGPAASATLPSRDDIVDAVREMLGGR